MSEYVLLIFENALQKLILILVPKSWFYSVIYETSYLFIPHKYFHEIYTLK